MARTFLDEKISSFIEDKFPEFVKADHPVFVDFLRLYYQFMEASKITLTDVLGSDQILLENKLTTNYLANEFDDTRFVYEDSTYGAFIKDEQLQGKLLERFLLFFQRIILKVIFILRQIDISKLVK